MSLDETRAFALRSFGMLMMIVALSATNGISAQGTNEKIRVGTFPIDVTAAAYYAHEQGFFKKVGLDVEVITGQNGAVVASAVASGSMEFGDANTTVLASAHEHGLPFVLVAPNGIYQSKAPTAALVVFKSSPISSARDLAGKTIGIAVLKGIAEVGARAWLEQNNVSMGSVKFLELNLSEMDAALAGGRLDAVVIEEPQLSKLLAAGNTRIIARPYDAIGPRWEQGAYFCTLEYAKAHPDIVARFGEAIRQAGLWANNNHAESAKILAKYFKAPILPTQTRIAYPARLRASDLQPLIDASAKYGIIGAPFAAADMFAPGLSP